MQSKVGRGGEKGPCGLGSPGHRGRRTMITFKGREISFLLSTSVQPRSSIAFSREKRIEENSLFFPFAVSQSPFIPLPCEAVGDTRISPGEEGEEGIPCRHEKVMRLRGKGPEMGSCDDKRRPTEQNTRRIDTHREREITQKRRVVCLLCFFPFSLSFPLTGPLSLRRCMMHLSSRHSLHVCRRKRGGE